MATALRPFVLAHGSWHGGWCWRAVAQRLRAAGHAVFAPSFTGMGDRAHLLRDGITLDTFVDDLAGVIESEELTDVVLVGHSFGGLPISGVADRMPQRLARLVYLDAIVVEPGETAFAGYPPERVAQRLAAAAAHGGLAAPVPQPIPPGWGLVPGTPLHDWAARRMTPHPIASYTTPLAVTQPVGNGLPCHYLHCGNPAHPVLDRSRALVHRWIAEGRPNWQWNELDAPHEAPLTHPDLCAQALLSLAR